METSQEKVPPEEVITTATATEMEMDRSDTPPIDLFSQNDMLAQSEEDDDIDEDGVRCTRRYHRANVLKRPTVDPERLFSVRKRLFYDCMERPTDNVFYMEGERIDMQDPLTCTIQRGFFARIFNSMVNFSKSEFKEKNTLHRNMTWEAKLTENRLKSIVASDFKDYHLTITSAVSYILRAMEDIKHIRNDEMIFQLVPITCTIDKGVKKRLDVNNLDLRQVNNSKSLSVNLNVDVKFLYSGTIRVKTIPDQGEKYYVSPTQCMGSYMNVAVTDLYDVVYDRTKQYIKRFFERYPVDPTAVTTDVYASGDTSVTSKDLNDMMILKYLLRTVGRDINLKKLDLDKIGVFVLTSSLKTKPKYLNAKDGNTVCYIDSTPKPDTEAVFLSSFTRARIMEDGSLNFQIYSRACIYMSDDQEFSELIK